MVFFFFKWLQPVEVFQLQSELGEAHLELLSAQLNTGGDEGT